MIRIALRDISSSRGLEIDQKIPKEGIGLSDEEVDITSPLHITASLKWANDTVLATAHLEADFGFLCSRCLETIHEHQSRDYNFTFEITTNEEYIDLGEEIRQEIIVENPARILCKEECKGICAECGTNLNIEVCKCKK